ncbi:MAG: M23 family metallopeptidase [Hyphomonadaceae bacterium]|nr:M23 family metallopeptidase [Hyphomonadaceae bacterium]
MHARLVLLGLLAAGCSTGATAPPATDTGPLGASAGLYRLPYADGISVKVFDDFNSHRAIGRIDFFATGDKRPFSVVAAASGRIAAIQDTYTEQQSGRAAKDCRNNYVWIEHPNGEWSNYAHLATSSVTGLAGLKVGDSVKAGQFIGHEAAVGCAMLDHVHFEIARPVPSVAIDEGGFLTDNANSQRERHPRFCTVEGDFVRKDSVYIAGPCR